MTARALPSAALLFGGLTLLAACGDVLDDTSDGSPPAGGNANYGSDRIGYKNASLGEAGGDTGADPANAGSAQYEAYGGDGDGAWYDDGDYGGTGGVGGMAPPVQDAGTPMADAGMADAGMGEGLGNALVDPPAEPGPPENPFHTTTETAATTFGIDVDTGSYTLTRAAVRNGQLPAAESVRIEEFLNYFHFHYAQPESDEPFGLYAELGACPWNPDSELLLLGIQGQEVELKDQPAANLVFLLDVSGSMNDPAKLPLLKKGFRMMTRQLRDDDVVSIVTYAGRDAVVLDGVPGSDKDTILAALDNLSAGGSTNGEGGIQRAYEVAASHFIDGGNNRVLLATDGDFNVGLSDVEELKSFIATKRDTGVFLSVYGFGRYDGVVAPDDDATMEQLADNGNGIYFFIDGPEEARRSFIHTLSGSLLTIAKDVKAQVEFNPARVKGYRLIGYENRVIANSDFSNDSVDAGELGAGLSVTALFELIAADSPQPVPTPLPGTVVVIESSGDGADPTEAIDEFDPVGGTSLFEVRLRFKDPDADQSKLVVHRYGEDVRRSATSPKHAFASAVAEFAMDLRRSQYVRPATTEALLERVDRAIPLDAEGAVEEFRTLVGDARALH